MNVDEQKQAYVENVGHEPRNLPDDHPDLEQWLHGLPKPEEKPEPPPTHEDQEELPV